MALLRSFACSLPGHIVASRLPYSQEQLRNTAWCYVQYYRRMHACVVRMYESYYISASPVINKDVVAFI